MNIASWFSVYRLIAAELERERASHAETIRLADEKERQYVDALARAANKPTVFDRPAPVTPSHVPMMAFGPTADAARQHHKQKEHDEAIAARRAVEAKSNGQVVDIPTIPNQ